jgi:predicted CoA-substrate-specific enzyme activase
MYYAGVDIGSTAAKTALFENDKLIGVFVVPTGWSSIKTANEIKERITSKGVKENDMKVVATGYGRVSVPYAHKTITEITCHGKGAAYLTGEDCTVVDIGGQDTKVITVEDGMIKDFIMNDKCSAGTGRFLEIMANTLGVDIDTMCDLAEKGSGVTISSMCTVFAESEVISLIGRGEKKEDIAYAVVDSIVSKVASLCRKHSEGTNYFLTGGLCGCEYIVNRLSEKLKRPVKTDPMARYAGAIGAGILAQKIQ